MTTIVKEVSAVGKSDTRHENTFPQCIQCGYIYPDDWSPCPNCNGKKDDTMRILNRIDRKIDKILAIYEKRSKSWEKCDES